MTPQELANLFMELINANDLTQEVLSQMDSLGLFV